MRFYPLALCQRLMPFLAVWQYSSSNTEAVQWALRTVSGGRSIAQLLGELLWRPIGAAHEALLTRVDADTTMASGGLSATARDLGRWGQMLLAGGVGGGGQRVLAEGWVESILAEADEGAERFGWACA